MTSSADPATSSVDEAGVLDESGGLLSSTDESIATVRIDRREARNALSTPVLARLARTLRELEADGAKCIVITGSDNVFASGADLKTLADTDALELYFGERATHWDDVRKVQVPLVAAVDGYCLGAGFELALMCDIVVASEEAQFGLPETGLGLVPGAGGTQRLPRALGKAKTMEVVLAGRVLTAFECERAGIVSRVVTREALLDEALSIAREVASRAPIAQLLAKQLVNASFDLPLESGLAMERNLFAIAFSSQDAREGIRAYLEKRKPSWLGR